MTHHINGICAFVESHGMLECAPAKHRDWALPNRIRYNDLVPLNGICDAISNDIGYSTKDRKLYTFHFCFPPFSHAFVDHPSDMMQCAFVHGLLDGNLYHKYSKHDGRPRYSRNESTVRD